jgi:glycosyltransferase involved in cell wall biosynthesis
MAKAMHVPYDLVARSMFKRAKAVVCVSAAEERQLLEMYPSVAGRTTVIYNSVDVRSLIDAEPMKTTHPLILTAGRLWSYKGIDRLIEGVELLTTPVRLVIAGDGPERGPIEELAKRARQDVRVLGRISDDELRSWQQAADLVVSLSMHEAFGILLLEGAAAGARLLASDIPAHREVGALIGSGIGYIDPKADAAQIARRLDECLHLSPPDPSSLNLPTWDAAAATLLALYRSIA